MEEKEHLAQRKHEIDELVSKLPLFLPFSQNSLLELCDTQEKGVAHPSHIDDDPIDDYWDHKFTQKIRFIHLPTFLQWLRTEKVSEGILSKLEATNSSCLQDLDQTDRDLIKEFV